MDTTFLLGRFSFRLKSSDLALLEALTKLFPKTNLEHKTTQVIDLDNPRDIISNWSNVVPKPEGFEIIRLIVRKALDNHQDCLWMDAATLVSPQGKTILIAGPSHSGKSTAAIALAYGKAWSVLSEDITLIDAGSGAFLRFASPLSIRAGSIEKVKIATGVAVGTPVDTEWLELGHLASTKAEIKRIDFLYFLPKTDPNTDEPFQVDRISVNEAVRKLLPLSNILHLSTGLEIITTALASAQCHTVKGGCLSERVGLITNNCDSVMTR